LTWTASKTLRGRAIVQLFNLIEDQQTTIRQLQEENQRLRDENNRLKGEQGKPDIKANAVAGRRCGRPRYTDRAETRATLQDKYVPNVARPQCSPCACLPMSVRF
jgi:regulator of replication initiation timing